MPNARLEKDQIGDYRYELDLGVLRCTRVLIYACIHLREVRCRTDVYCMAHVDYMARSKDVIWLIYAEIPAKA